MDAVQHRPIYTNLQSHISRMPTSDQPLKKESSKSLEHEVLLKKISHQQKKNNEELIRQQSLQSTLTDLRTLLHSTSAQNQEYCKNLQKQNMKLKEKVNRLTASLKFVHQQGKHFENCQLFWKEFVV